MSGHASSLHVICKRPSFMIWLSPHVAWWHDRGWVFMHRMCDLVLVFVFAMITGVTCAAYTCAHCVLQSFPYCVS